MRSPAFTAARFATCVFWRRAEREQDRDQVVAIRDGRKQAPHALALAVRRLQRSFEPLSDQFES